MVRRPHRYGDAGSPEIAAALGYSSTAGFLGGAGFRYFVVDGVAPGVEGEYVSGGNNSLAYGLALASLRLVPVRMPGFALVVTGRAGRIFFADHDDAWGAGGGAGLVFAVGGGAALELAYDYLRILPASRCADLVTCALQGPVLGFRFGF
jgi:hypothetical protein